jgi:hypothetical protein
MDVAALAVVRRRTPRSGWSWCCWSRSGRPSRRWSRARRVDHLQRHFRGLAGGDLRLFLGAFLVAVDRRFEAAGQVAAHAPLEGRARVASAFGEALSQALRSLTEPQPDHARRRGCRRASRRARRPSRGPRGRRRFPRRRAASRAPWSAGLVGRAEADHGLGRRSASGGRRPWRLDRACGRWRRVVAVDSSVSQPEASKRALVGRIGQRDRPSMEMPLLSQKHDQLVELEMAGKRDRLLADAFHQAAVAGDDIGVVIDQVGAEARASLRSAMAMPTALASPGRAGRWWSRCRRHGRIPDGRRWESRAGGNS